jgi:hypothetical protein
MYSQMTYQLRNLSIKFHTENCTEETCILSVLISHEPNCTCRISENTNSFVFRVCFILVNEVGAPITVQSECTTLTRLAKWVVSGAFTPVLPFSIYFKILCKWEGTMVILFLFLFFSILWCCQEVKNWKRKKHWKRIYHSFLFQFISKFFLKAERPICRGVSQGGLWV